MFSSLLVDLFVCRITVKLLNRLSQSSCEGGTRSTEETIDCNPDPVTLGLEPGWGGLWLRSGGGQLLRTHDISRCSVCLT